MAIEIVDFPSYKMVIFHSFLYVYQRVIPQISEQVVGGSNSDGSFAKKKKRWENHEKLTDQQLMRESGADSPDSVQTSHM